MYTTAEKVVPSGLYKIGTIGQEANCLAGNGRRTAFDELASGVGSIKGIEQRVFALMDKLVGMPLDAAGNQYPPRDPGLIGDIGEAGRDLSRCAEAMGQYLDAIERALP